MDSQWNPGKCGAVYPEVWEVPQESLGLRASPGARGSSHLGKALITSTASNARTSPWGMGDYLLDLRAKYIQYTTPFTTTTTAPSVTWMAVVKPAGYNTLVM